MPHVERTTLTAVLIALLLSHVAARATAQTLEAASPDAAWALVKDLPVASRLTLTTTEQQFDATLAAVRGDELVITDASLQRTTLRQATGAPSGFIVPRASLTGTRVKKMGNQYKAAPGEVPNPVTVRHVLEALGMRKELELRTAGPRPIVGRIDSLSDTSVTVVHKKKPTEVSLRDIRAARANPPFSRHDAILLGVIAGAFVALYPFLVAAAGA